MKSVIHNGGTMEQVEMDPQREEDDADCEGCNRDDCKGCAYNEAHPPPDFVTKAGTRIFILEGR